MGKNISITLWGNCIEKQKWVEWYNDVKNLFNELGYVHTHIGIHSKSYNSGKVVTVTRKEKEILSKMENGEEIKNLTLCSLPSDYKIAMFDYDVLCARDTDYLTFVMKAEDYSEYHEKVVLSILMKYVDFEYGEIYSVSRDELPMLYAGTRDERNLDTYQFIKEIKK